MLRVRGSRHCQNGGARMASLVAILVGGLFANLAAAETSEDLVAMRSASFVSEIASQEAEAVREAKVILRHAQQSARQRAMLRKLAKRKALLHDSKRLRQIADSLAIDGAVEVAEATLEEAEHPIVVDLGERKLHYYDSAGVRLTFPITSPRPSEEEFGVMRVTKKRDQPIWIPTPNQRKLDPTLPKVVRPGPENPLGSRALNLSRGYLRIHGTNEPETIGQAVSDGCYRMYNTHVEMLFDLVDVGMTVMVR